MMTKKQECLVEILQKNVVEVIFKKVNGEERIMKCTLNENILPEIKNVTDKKTNENVLPVWDIDKEGWRSFRIDSVISMKPLEGLLG